MMPEILRRRAPYPRLTSLLAGLVGIAAATAAVGVPLHAQEMPVPVETQVSIISRVLAFDRRFSSGDDDLVVAVVHQSRFRESLTAATQAADYFDGMNVGGRTIRSVMVAIDDFAELERAIGGSEVDLVYVAPLRAVSVERITSLTRDLGILTCTGVPEYVSGGLGLGISDYGGRPRILIHLEGTQAEGSQFSSELLKLARIVDDPNGHGG